MKAVTNFRTLCACVTFPLLAFMLPACAMLALCGACGLLAAFFVCNMIQVIIAQICWLCIFLAVVGVSHGAYIVTVLLSVACIIFRKRLGRAWVWMLVIAGMHTSLLLVLEWRCLDFALS